jgi:membrane-associated phospholipid phosphatase
MLSKKKVISVLLFVALFLGVTAQNLDIDIAKSINPQNPNSPYWIATSGSTYFISASVPVCLFMAGLIKNDHGLKRKSYEIFGAIAIELAVSETMKIIIDRPRPAQMYPGEIFPYSNVSGYSFPSGHSSLAFATAASLSIIYKKWYVTIPAYLWAASVGYARIYLGVHYPSDVLAGAIVGIGSAYLSHWVSKKLFGNYN